MRPDPHSYCDDTQPQVMALQWFARVDFEARVLHCNATLKLVDPPAHATPLDLDTRDLVIEHVTDQAGKVLRHELGKPDPVLGARLRVHLPPGTRTVAVAYRTGKDASALQWLGPEQTHDGRAPYLYSQCQAIHARSIVPLQDSPRVRITYEAVLDVPAKLRSLMSAGYVARWPLENDRAADAWSMTQPIPPYLLALAVGELAGRDVGARTRVWSEPSFVDAAAEEFSGTGDMLREAEALYGPYDWERFDVLVLPPSFPYGGMENPRLTFLTPSTVVGDKSAVNVVAHELAHAWTGNLVTNASAEHFWLNEGWTVYAERRIHERLHGREASELEAALGRRELERAVERFASRLELTRLRPPLEGVDPDEVYSEVPYEKGYLFLRALEEQVGREAFDTFVQKYISTFRFRSITTDDFLALAEKELPPATLERVDAKAWIDGAGVPEGAPRARSARLEAVEALGASPPPPELAQRWTPTEWRLYLERLPRPLPTTEVAALDEKYHLTEAKNHDVLAAWLELGILSDHAPAIDRTGGFVAKVGRMKYLRPLYRALAKNEKTRAIARPLFEASRAMYHPIAATVIRGILEKEGL